MDYKVIDIVIFLVLAHTGTKTKSVILISTRKKKEVVQVIKLGCRVGKKNRRGIKEEYVVRRYVKYGNFHGKFKKKIGDLKDGRNPFGSH